MLAILAIFATKASASVAVAQTTIAPLTVPATTANASIRAAFKLPAASMPSVNLYSTVPSVVVHQVLKGTRLTTANQ